MAGLLVLVRGIVRGMGRETGCELLARRQALPGASGTDMGHYGYTEGSILEAPSDLPDGSYIVTVAEGYTVPMTKQGGLWLVDEASGLTEPG